MKVKDIVKNNKYKILVIITLIILGILITYRTTYINKSRNLETNLGKASTDELTGKLIVQEGVKLAKGTTGYDCSAFVKKVLENCSATVESTSGAFGSSAWFDGYISVNGNKPQRIADVPKGDNKAWYEAVETSELRMGDIITGEGHMFIYIGEYSDESELKDQLNKLGIDLEGVYIHTNTSYWRR